MPRQIPIESLIPYPDWSPYADLHRERIRAHEKHGGQGGDSTERRPWFSLLKWLAIIGEEWGEVSRAINEYHLGNLNGGADGLKRELRSELIQVAAMCAAWIDAIDEGAVV